MAPVPSWARRSNHGTLGGETLLLPTNRLRCHGIGCLKSANTTEAIEGILHLFILPAIRQNSKIFEDEE